MSRFKSLAHSIWYCHYHIVWVPKYRFRILRGKIKKEVEKMIKMTSEKQGCIVEELNIQEDHVHLLVMVPPKISISKVIIRVEDGIVRFVPAGRRVVERTFGWLS